MLTAFRAISLIEGLSFLVILSVTLGVIPRDYVFMLGMTHGVLFLVYLIIALVVSGQRSWSVITWFLLWAAALVPFAFIAVDMFLRKEQSHSLELATDSAAS